MPLSLVSESPSGRSGHTAGAVSWPACPQVILIRPVSPEPAPAPPSESRSLGGRASAALPARGACWGARGGVREQSRTSRCGGPGGAAPGLRGVKSEMGTHGDSDPWSLTTKGPSPPSLVATMSITFPSPGPPWNQRPPWEGRGARREGKTGWSEHTAGRPIWEAGTEEPALPSEGKELAGPRPPHVTLTADL